MAYSGSRDFIMTRTEVIQEALEKAGAIKQGMTPTPAMTASAKMTLNVIIKEWETKGINLWRVNWQTATLTTSSRVVNATAQVYECVRNHTAAGTDEPINGADFSTFWYKKVEAETHASGTAYVADDIVLGSDAQAYKCILAHTASAATTPITGGTYATYWAIYATTWVNATAYTTICQVVLPTGTIDVDDMFVRYAESDTPVHEITQDEYFNLSDKHSSATQPTKYWLRQGLTMDVFLYPFPDDTDAVIHYGQVLSGQDLDATTDNPDMPNRWYGAIIAALSYELSHKYGLNLNERQMLEVQADKKFAFAKSDDNEGGDIQFGIAR